MLHESMADTAGDKGAGSRKSYAKRASSEDISHSWLDASARKVPELDSKLKEQRKISFARP